MVEPAMRTCAHCGHANADHLPYCASCGKRLRALGPTGETPPPQLGPPPGKGLSKGETGSSGFAAAATVALGPSRPGSSGLATDPTALGPVLAPAPGSAWARARESVKYVFATIRGRIDAEEQRRNLTSEREGARRMAESTLVELGHAVLIQGIEAPALRELTEAAARLKKRREAVATDLAAAEKFQAAEDLRLGLLEAAVETECKAYEQRVGEVEQTLARHAAERQADNAARGDTAGTPGPAASPSEKMKLDDQQRALRERAAALRASSMAARARLEQAAATRRQSAAAIAASVAGHTRERATIEEEGRTLTGRIGARALQLRISSPHLAPGYDRYDRLQETIRTQDAELARLEHSKSGLDRRKLAVGLSVLGASLGALGAGLWALLR